MREIAKVPALAPRKAETHKGDYGRVLVLAGSAGYTGAAYLCAKAALRTGAGLVTLGIPESLNTILAAKLTCVMTRPLPETDERSLCCAGHEAILEFSEAFDVVAMGPGMGTHPDTQKLVLGLLESLRKPIVLDADGLTAVCEDPSVIARTQHTLVLTPHPGEMARLSGLPSAQEVQKDRLKLAVRFAKRRHALLVLKGHETIVTDGERIFINTTGNPGMATAGSGDVLTGMIASLIAQGVPPFGAAQLGVYLHGAAGDVAAGKFGQAGMIATDILDSLPCALAQHSASQEHTTKPTQ